MSENIDTQRFDLHALAARFPASANSLLLDQYLTREAAVSTRLFRAYKPVPAHYHLDSDEHLYVLSGRGILWMGDESDSKEFGPGDLIRFARGVVHAQPAILEEPVVFLAFDTPARKPEDVHFVDPANGSPRDFIQGLTT